MILKWVKFGRLCSNHLGSHVGLRPHCCSNNRDLMSTLDGPPSWAMGLEATLSMHWMSYSSRSHCLAQQTQQAETKAHQTNPHVFFSLLVSNLNANITKLHYPKPAIKVIFLLRELPVTAPSYLFDSLPLS